MCVCVLQGARVWVREKEQLVPSTVNSCGDGTLVVTTDYGAVRDTRISFTGIRLDIHHLRSSPEPSGWSQTPLSLDHHSTMNTILIQLLL